MWRLVLSSGPLIQFGASAKPLLLPYAFRAEGAVWLEDASLLQHVAGLAHEFVAGERFGEEVHTFFLNTVMGDDVGGIAGYVEGL